MSGGSFNYLYNQDVADINLDDLRRMEDELAALAAENLPGSDHAHVDRLWAELRDVADEPRRAA